MKHAAKGGRNLLGELPSFLKRALPVSTAVMKRIHKEMTRKDSSETFHHSQRCAALVKIDPTVPSSKFC